MQYSMHLPAQQKAKMNQILGSAYKAPFQNKKAAGTVLQWCESASPSANYINLNCCMSWIKSRTFSSRDTYPLWRNCRCLEKPVCYYLLLPQLLVALSKQPSTGNQNHKTQRLWVAWGPYVTGFLFKMIWSKTPWVAVALTHNVQDLERTYNATVALQEITMTQKHPRRQRNVFLTTHPKPASEKDWH